MDIQKLKIFGERNTGTHALTLLIERNIGDILCGGANRDMVPNWTGLMESVTKIPQSSGGGRKGLLHHAFVDDLFAKAPAECQWKHTAPVYSPRFVDQKIGVIFLVKNPYSWSVSLFKSPHNVIGHNADGFSAFLRNPWLTMRRDQLTGVVASPLALWNAKLAAYQRFAAIAASHGLPYLFLRFEDFVADQLKALRSVRDMFDLPGDTGILVTNSTKDGRFDLDYYKSFYGAEAWRGMFSTEDLRFCAKTIDWSVAADFQYAKIPLPLHEVSDIHG